MRPPRISRFKRTINLPRTVPLCFSLLYENMVLVSFLEQFVAGRPFYSKENASTQNFAVQEDDKHDAYSTSLFFPPVSVFRVFSGAVFPGRRFHSKENASAQNFAVQEDDKLAAYSTSYFFPPVYVFCVFS